jgi:molybdate-binding protein
VEVETARAHSELADNVVIMGCAAALGLLADRLNSRNGPGRFVWLATSSTRALESLARRETHIAGVHLVDSRSGEANLPDVRRHAGADPVVIITLARWEAGLVAAAGNPKRIHGVTDLARRSLRIVTRETGAGARRLLDREVRAAGLTAKLTGRSLAVASGHLEVAQTVALGAADVGVATCDAAIAFGLHFIPLAEERYDLVVPRAAMDDARIRRLFDVMTAGPMRRELSSLGYDVRACGERVAELSAD